MAGLNDAFPSKYLKADDLKGRDVPVVIAGWSFENIGTPPEKKLVLSFQGRDKTMVCNKVNASRIASLYGGDDFDDWIGKEIILTTEFVEFQGKTTKGVRVKAPTKPAAAQAKAKADLDDEIPFN